MRTLFDTSVLVPAGVDQLGNHEAALNALGLTSGAIYDALHMDCARRLAADQILTYNVSHFDRFRVPGIAIREP